MPKQALLAVLTALALATAATAPGLAQAQSDADGDGITDATDQCPTQAGPAVSTGCPDADADGIADTADACPTASSLAGPDLDRNGCLEPISVLSQRFRFVAGRPGFRLTRLRLDVVTGIESILARLRCRGVRCSAAPRRRGHFLVFRITRKRLRPGTRLKITTRNRFGGGPLECFSLRVPRRGGPKTSARRAITLGFASFRC